MRLSALRSLRSPQRLFFFVCFVSLCFPCLAVDDTLPKGRLRFSMDYHYQTGDTYRFNDEREVATTFNDAPADYDFQKIDMTLEWGWQPNITLVFETSFDRRELSGPNGGVTTDGIPGVYMGVRQRLSTRMSDSWFITETGVFVPADADEEELLPIGSDSVDWYTIASYGQEFLPGQGGFTLDFGYIFRNEAPEDAFIFNTTFWTRLFALGVLELEYDVYESSETSNRDWLITEYPDDHGYQRFSFAFKRNLTPRWEFNLGYRNLVKGRSIAETSGLFLGFSWLR